MEDDLVAHDDGVDITFTTIKKPMKDANGKQLYEKNFKKSIMLKHEQTSFEALQWINYQEAIFRRDFNDNSLRIEQSYYRGEIEYYGLKPDGYLKVADNTEYFFEYQGCHVHPDCPYNCNTKSILSENDIRKRRITWERKKEYFDQPPRKILITQRSCIWAGEKHDLDLTSLPSTSMPRVLCNDNVDTLIEAIKNDEVFGFVVCDVSTPEELRASYGKFFFPPIFRHEDIDESMVSGYMMRRVKEEKRKLGSKTVLQCYNGEQLLVFTPLLKFYIEEGLVVSNVTQFIQYEPANFSKPFMDTVTKMRVEATMTDDAGKQLTAKV